MNTLVKERFLYIDYLRLLVIAFVVMLHLAVTYSAIGSWYYYEPVELDALSIVAFALFQSFTQGYTMGFMFLLAGFFVPGTYDRKGFLEFIKGRLFRLGIPTLIYMLVIHPLNTLILSGYYGMESGNLLQAYLHYITSLEFVGSTGPLWFALVLLIFSVIYAFVRRLLPEPAAVERTGKLTTSHVMILILMITAAAFLIRLVQPIGTSILNLQLCFFAQYIILFVVGLKAYRNHWLDQINYKWGVGWLKAALTLGIIAWLAIIFLGDGMTKGLDPFTGGLNWTSFAYAAWESFVAVSMSVGLLALFKERFNQFHKTTKALADNAFTVYLFHAPIIIAICYSMRDIHIAPILKFLIACIVCLPTCFAISHFVIRRVPILKRML